MKNFKNWVQIKNPCKEDWGKMDVYESGRFCMNCSKIVTDFTQLNDKEIAKILKNSSDSVCGRFKQSQLNRELVTGADKIYSHRIYKLFAGMLFFSLANNSFAYPGLDKIEEKEILNNEINREGSLLNPEKIFPLDSSRFYLHGKIFDKNYKDPLPGVVIKISKSSIGIQTDINGEYRINFPEQDLDDTLHIEIIYAGYKMIKYSISKNDLPLTKDFYLEDDLSLIEDIVYSGGIYSNLLSTKKVVCNKKKWWQLWKK